MLARYAIFSSACLGWIEISSLAHSARNQRARASHSWVHVLPVLRRRNAAKKLAQWRGRGEREGSRLEWNEEGQDTGWCPPVFIACGLCLVGNRPSSLHQSVMGGRRLTRWKRADLHYWRASISEGLFHSLSARRRVLG